MRFPTPILLVLLLAGCASKPEPARPAPLLLVSIDGLRARDVDAMPTLSEIGRQGVRAEAMRPSYPSLTFPNHYSLVTGLRPDRHGLVHNNMHDAELGRFSLGNRDAVGDGRWWGGEPIWIGARKAGLRSATMFWPGSEAEIAGHHPDYWHLFDGTLSAQARVQQILDWLDLPVDERPDLLTLYFDQVDSAGHDKGPDSAEARQAREQVDQALAGLLAALERRGLAHRVNLIVVSDHGMAEVAPRQAIAFEDALPVQHVDIVSGGQIIGVNPKAGQRELFDTVVATQLPGRHAHYQCWRKQDLPLQWHYGTHARIPAIVCQMDEGWDMLPKAVLEARRDAGPRGSHGYDPSLPSMQAAFVARGPAFCAGRTLPAFDNVDVYPLLARLLRITPAANDGDIRPLQPALCDRAPAD